MDKSCKRKKKKREILKKIHLRILKTAQEGQYVLQPNCLAETASPPLWTQGKPQSAESWLLDLLFPNDSAKQCLCQTPAFHMKNSV